MIRRTRFAGGLAAVVLLAAASASGVGTTPAAAAQTCHGKPVTMVVTGTEDGQVDHGTDGDDVVLLNGSKRHTFYAEGGDDTICAEGYGSEVYGGAGDDWINAEKTEQKIEAYGGDGDDTIIGSDGGDLMYGGEGSDTLRGLAGGDRLYPDETDFDHHGEVDQDAADTVDGGAGDDIVTLSVLSADKTSGSDKLIGGSGSDFLVVDGVPIDLDIPQETLAAAAGGPTDQVAGFDKYAITPGAEIRGSNRDEFFDIRGDHSRVEAKGGDDEILVTGDDAVISAGGGNDRVDLQADQAKQTVGLGHGDDELLIQRGGHITAKGGPGDDEFRLLTHGEFDDEPGNTGPIRSDLRGGSGTDTLSWDCKSTVDVSEHQLGCTHHKASVQFAGMQIYRATEWPKWNDTFRGGPGRDIFYGGTGDDTMYGGKGNDKLIGGKGNDFADGGPGKDVCQAETKKRC